MSQPHNKLRRQSDWPALSSGKAEERARQRLILDRRGIKNMLGKAD